jgi:CRP-like cAMP-binding protein
LQRGAVIVTKADVEIARIAEPGAVFGEMSYLLQKPATATVSALQEVALHVAEEPGSYLLENPDVLIYVAGIMARRLEAVNRYLVDLKNQYADRSDHLGMVDEVLENLMARYPRAIERRRVPGETDE